MIRSKIAKKLVSADHKGSSSVCVEGMDSATKRVDYCKKEIVDDRYPNRPADQSTTEELYIWA